MAWVYYDSHCLNVIPDPYPIGNTVPPFDFMLKFPAGILQL
jgi:hypothetical protein